MAPGGPRCRRSARRPRACCPRPWRCWRFSPSPWPPLRAAVSPAARRPAWRRRQSAAPAQRRLASGPFLPSASRRRFIPEHRRPRGAADGAQRSPDEARAHRWPATDQRTKREVRIMIVSKSHSSFPQPSRSALPLRLGRRAAAHDHPAAAGPGWLARSRRRPRSRSPQSRSRPGRRPPRRLEEEEEEEEMTSFFSSTTVTATGSPDRVVRGVDAGERPAQRGDRAAGAGQRRRPAALPAGRRRQRRRAQPVAAGDPRPARPARAVSAGRSAHEQPPPADRLRRDPRPGGHRVDGQRRDRARSGLGALRQRRHRRRAQPDPQDARLSRRRRAGGQLRGARAARPATSGRARARSTGAGAGRRCSSG